MRGKYIVEATLAIIVVSTYCYLVIVDKVDVTGFGVIAIYIIKKYLDGVSQERKNGK